MEFKTFYSALVSTKSLIPKEKLDSILKLYEEHNLGVLARVLLNFRNGIIVEHPLPKYNKELFPTLKLCLSEFQDVLETDDSHNLIKILSRAITNTRLEKILVILGQRITDGSIQTKDSFPPIPSILVNSAKEVNKEGLSLAARARSKHVGRDKFWGQIKGKTEDKNIDASIYITNIISNHTWWNVYGHFKHKIVFEMRIPSGHGARWSGDGTVFIGFVEPFDLNF